MSRFGPATEHEEEPCDIRPRCHSCGSLLAEFVSRPWAFKCRRCSAITSAGDVPSWIMDRLQKNTR